MRRFPYNTHLNKMLRIAFRVASKYGLAPILDLDMIGGA